jgi:tetratricopeptide (TPR) repeat protein
MIRKNMMNLAFPLGAVILFWPCPCIGQAQEKKYAAVEIHNNCDFAIRYSVRWGNDAWQETTLKPGLVWCHWYPYANPKEQKSPALELQFQSGIANGRSITKYTLSKYASAEKLSGGKPYYFARDKDKDGVEFIDLFEGTGKAIDSPELKLAMELLGKNEPDQALAKLNALIRANPNDAAPYPWRGRAYLDKGDIEKALADCNEAIRLSPNLANAYNVRGLVYRAQGEYDEALADFDKAVRLTPQAIIYSNRGLVHANKKNYDEAIKDQTEAIRLDPKESWFLIRRGNGYVGKKNYEAGIVDLSEAIRLKPGFALSHNWRGLAYFYAGRFAEAIADYDEAIRLDPRFAFAFSNRGAAQIMKRDYDLAIKDCTEAIRLNPKTDRAYWWRSRAYAKKGETALAKADYERSIQLNPANGQLQLDIEYAGRSFAPVAYRQEALRKLRSFPLGSTLPVNQLYEINKYPGMYEPVDKVQNPLPEGTRELIKYEKLRHERLEMEMVAAANQFLSAAKLSPAAREAEGIDLQWLYGPVSPVTDRFLSKDDLAGMRLIGRLILKDGKEITTIFPITYFPNLAPDSSVGEDGKRGRPGILWGADNFRILVRFYFTGTPKKDYAHQSFSVSNKEDGTQDMKPGLNVNEQTGMLVDPYIRQSALGTRCFDCHAKGSNLNLKGDNYYYKQMKEKKYEAMVGFAGFLKLAAELGASASDRDEVAAAMKKDPALLIPVDELIRANEEYWIRRYPAYKKRLKTFAPPPPGQGSGMPSQDRDGAIGLAQPPFPLLPGTDRYGMIPPFDRFQRRLFTRVSLPFFVEYSPCVPC